MDRRFMQDGKQRYDYRERNGLRDPPESQASPYSGSSNSANLEVQGFPSYPVQPYHTQVASRTFAVKHAKMAGKDLMVLDRTAGANTLSYTTTVSSHKPQLMVQRASTSPGEAETLVGMAAFYTLTSKIDVQIGGVGVTLQRHHHNTPTPHATFTYTSASHPQARRLKWRSKTSFEYLDFDCVSEQSGVVIARFLNTKWSMSKLGQLEILGQNLAHDEKLVDELVVLVLALVGFSQLEQARNSAVI
ncbi:hypothetical protein A1O3_03951 [Capronia epimyces CBS 606.96]|uniref:Tubby C-terminal domain-containing protein n=1 Tax=Capronia epimyces CBS 606.96 TaxID=1182542 RepID=W9YXH1_9EURO|nr:uncharacterized protein A1O3_03951 [Capronia epimyces CBS 606.96]EXJ86994.1 hypothetical protein A1O3_03951 [Capronia epimyces CBS 606.96]